MATIRRNRSRAAKVKIDKAEIVNRVISFFEKDDEDRSIEKQMRLQRYAKYRMWTEGKDWPWPDSSDVPLPDMAEKALHMQDVLNNAVMSTRPVIQSKAVDRHSGKKEDNVDRLLDHEFFVEQKGEDIVGDLTDAFVVDGVFVAFIPWVKESREVSELTTFPLFGEDEIPANAFAGILEDTFGNGAQFEQTDKEGWDYIAVKDGKTFEVKFYTRKNTIEMVTQQKVVVFDGPKVIQKEWEDVLYPSQAANLQSPSPSNPHGASHVILVDYPSLDEIKKLKKKGEYDRITSDEMDMMEVASNDPTNREMVEQKDTFQGVTPKYSTGSGNARDHKTLTRLICFDTFDLMGTGLAQDVVFWVIKETKTLLRAEIMTEKFPSNPPRRPLVHKSFIPVRGRVAGISQIELIEGLHDMAKQLMDQVVDSGTMKISQPFFYRPAGSVKPSVIRMAPGEGYPLSDPQRDVFFPQTNTQSEVMGLNLIGIINQMSERLTTIGDLQLGRVPAGKASALRTVGGIQLIQGQGEARPERILRRFFNGLSEIWELMHEQNTFFLKKRKKLKISGSLKIADDPYVEIGPGDIRGQFTFEFKANVLNTSKQSMQTSIQALLGTYISPLAIQTGVIDADGIYRLLMEYGKSLGQDPEQYLKPPNPTAGLPRVFAEEIIPIVMSGQVPEVAPAEPGGAQEHLAKLQEIMQEDSFGALTDQEARMMRIYVEKLGDQVRLQIQQQQLLEASQQFGPGQGSGQPGPVPGGQPQEGQTQVNQNELLDETLPGAGGGANPGPGAQ